MKLVKLVKLVKLISVYFFDIFTSKKAQKPSVFTLLTSKCASRHNGVHFFDTFRHLNLQKWSEGRQFLTLLTWKCASRHKRRALFRHLNFQKWSEEWCVFVHFDFKSVLRATTACTFSTSQTSKSGPDAEVFCTFLTWKCASRHNGVHFFRHLNFQSGPNPWCLYILTLEMCFAPQRRATFISHLASWLRTRRFSEPTFRPPEPQIIGKHSVSRLFLPFRASASSFF